MTSTLSFQERFKDKLETIGKDGIFGLMKNSELSSNKQDSKISWKESAREDVKVNYSPPNLSKNSLFEIKETPIKKKDWERKKTFDGSFAKNGNLIINKNTPSNSNSDTNFIKNQTPIKSSTPLISTREMNITNTPFMPLGHLSQYNNPNMWNQPSTTNYNPSTYCDSTINNNINQVHLPNLTGGDPFSLRINNFQRIPNHLHSNNNHNLNHKQPKSNVQNTQFTPVKVLEKVNSHNTKINRENNSFPNNSKFGPHQGNSQRSFSSRFSNNVNNNLSKIDTNHSNLSNISVNQFNKNNMSKVSVARGGSSEAHRRDVLRAGSSEAYRESNRGGSSEASRPYKSTGLTTINEHASERKIVYKPYTLKEYKDLGSEKIVLGGLGPNIGTKEWEEKANKMKKINEYAENLKKQKKLVLKPIKEAPLEIIEKIKKEKVAASNRTKAALYGKKLKKTKFEGIDTKNYFSENLVNNNLIKNIYDDNRLDFGNFKEEEDEGENDDVIEFFKDDEIKINNYDFSEEINKRGNI